MISDALLRHVFRSTICELVQSCTSDDRRWELERQYLDALEEADRRGMDTHLYHGFLDYYKVNKAEITEAAR